MYDNLSWEYPGSRENSRESDILYYVLLIRELKNAFKTRGLLLSAAVPAGLENIKRGFNITELNKYYFFYK